MRIRRYFLALAALVIFSGTGVKAQEVKDGLTWYTNIDQVYELSNQTHKPIFAFFTGSDWCGWCRRLQFNVYSKPGFKEWAKKNVILLELDFPHNKQLPESLMQQNAGLQQFFNVQGFPTVWMFFMHKDDKEKKMAIEPLGSLGYPQSEPGQEEAAFLKNANAILAHKS